VVLNSGGMAFETKRVRYQSSNKKIHRLWFFQPLNDKALSKEHVNEVRERNTYLNG
jgi:hypothetical protein